MAIYEKFVGASRDDFLSLEDAQQNYKLSYSENFNFAYDVVDELGKKQPDKLAMIWVSNDGEEKKFTFKDIMLASNKAANYFKYLGIKKGDRVLLVLRRSYYFWFSMLGLHKIGAVAVQATDMLKAKDYVYRCNAGKIKCFIQQLYRFTDYRRFFTHHRNLCRFQNGFTHIYSHGLYDSIFHMQV